MLKKVLKTLRKSPAAKNRPDDLTLIVGLGNPGPEYIDTRHNIGFMVVERAAERAGITIKRKSHQGLLGMGHWLGNEVFLLLPQTFMNRSGSSVASACQSLGVPPGGLIVVHDEIDLPFASLKVKVGGGHGGHNGLRSIGSVLGETEFSRLRMGVGRPPVGGDVTRHVLNRFSSGERAELDNFLDLAVDALELMVSRGPGDAMNKYNVRNSPTTEQAGQTKG